ncbi:MAG: 50S ribosomal protein L28 [Gammaproteobacteria bacterium]|nr:50S ribosomal protein L28 [Gammaproteobacteria bacterium]
MQKKTIRERTHRKCAITGRITGFGQNVAHCNKKTKRTFQVNMHTKRVWVPCLGKFVRVRLSARGLKTLDKNGADFLVTAGVI